MYYYHRAESDVIGLIYELANRYNVFKERPPVNSKRVAECVVPVRASRFRTSSMNEYLASVFYFIRAIPRYKWLSIDEQAGLVFSLWNVWLELSELFGPSTCINRRTAKVALIPAT
jgi:hypothetical protein